MPDPLVPVNRKVAPQIQECYCSECGLVAPSWFHTNFVMHEGGFTCIWCLRILDEETGAPRRLLDLPEKPVGPYHVA